MSRSAACDCGVNVDSNRQPAARSSGAGRESLAQGGLMRLEFLCVATSRVERRAVGSRPWIIPASLLAFAMFAVPLCFADEASSSKDSIEEIIVTSRKAGTELSKAPVAVTEIS